MYQRGEAAASRGHPRRGSSTPFSATWAGATGGGGESATHVVSTYRCLEPNRISQCVSQARLFAAAEVEDGDTEHDHAHGGDDTHFEQSRYVPPIPAYS